MSWWRKIDVIFEAGTLHFHFVSKYSKLDGVKTLGTHGNINAIWWNIKISLQKLVHICRYELPTNMQNFTQIDLSKMFLKVFLGGYFFETPGICLSAAYA